MVIMDQYQYDSHGNWIRRLTRKREKYSFGITTFKTKNPEWDLVIREIKYAQ